MGEKNELGYYSFIIEIFKINIVQTYFPICVNAHA
jgi:hypothetical protein